MARTDDSTANQVILEAIAKLEAQRDELDVKIDALKAALKAEGGVPAAGETRRGRLSSAAKQKISESQRRRWEERRQQLQQLDQSPAAVIAGHPLDDLAQHAENGE